MGFRGADRESRRAKRPRIEASLEQAGPCQRAARIKMLPGADKGCWSGLREAGGCGCVEAEETRDARAALVEASFSFAAGRRADAGAGTVG